MGKKTIIAAAMLLCIATAFAQKEKKLTELLGKMPEKPAIKIDTLESVRVGEGWRHKVRYLAEEADERLRTPKDYIQAYVFVPDKAKKQKLPGIVAIHQDGGHNYIGYREVAGIMGDADQKYGLELYQRGYIVICPNRFLHAERRRITHPDTLADVYDEAEKAMDHRCGQLLMTGRNFTGKEVYDLMLTTDVLCLIHGLDKDRIGAIGHSAGGYVLASFMFADKRIKAGASSCGVFEMADWYDEDAIRKRRPFGVIPGMIGTARTSDYIGHIAPRPFLMTRGMHEWGKGSDKEKDESKRHVEGTQLLDREARVYYKAKKADDRLKTIYFEEAEGNHIFPLKVKEEVYTWLDGWLKK